MPKNLDDIISSPYLCVTKAKEMKATKKQIAEVTAKAIEMNVDVDLAISMLAECSAAMYKVMGAEGVVKGAKGAKLDLS